MPTAGRHCGLRDRCSTALPVSSLELRAAVQTCTRAAFTVRRQWQARSGGKGRVKLGDSDQETLSVKRRLQGCPHSHPSPTLSSVLLQAALWQSSLFRLFFVLVVYLLPQNHKIHKEGTFACVYCCVYGGSAIFGCGLVAAVYRRGGGVLTQAEVWL